MSYVKSINKENLKIARENIGLTTLSATKKISASKKDIVKEWENGESLPTWSQVSKLAQVYNLSELVFFSNKKLDRTKVIPDYRVGVDGDDDEQVKKLINLVITRQSWLEKKLQSEGYSKNSIQGSGKNIKTPKDLARFIKQSLEIDIEKIKSFSGYGARAKTLAYLIAQAESKGVFVGKTIAHIKIEVESMRGLFISNDYCPFIVLNRRDAQSAQIFSFIHELSHLFRKTDAISNVDFRNNNSNLDKEETFCNQVASQLLLPSEDFTKNAYYKNDIRDISETYNVSQLFIFYRLKELGKIPKAIQKDLENEIKAETKQGLIEKDKKKATGGDYNNNMKDSNGRLFNRFISNFYLSNQIDYVEASKLLRFSVESYE